MTPMNSLSCAQSGSDSSPGFPHRVGVNRQPLRSHPRRDAPHLRHRLHRHQPLHSPRPHHDLLHQRLLLHHGPLPQTGQSKLLSRLVEVKTSFCSPSIRTSSIFRWLVALGVSLAGTISVKFVGLFIVLYVGAFTAFDLWSRLGDVSKCYRDFVKHFLARAACLIVLPFTVYLLIFGLHTSVLTQTGPGDGYYSSLFQSTISGNPMQSLLTPLVINYGSRISLKSAHNMPCGYLHSHQDLYPEGVGAHQQMVSSYVHRDENNFFTVKPNSTLEGESRQVRSGDLVMLEHWATGRNLHSHKIPAVMAKTHFQVNLVTKVSDVSGGRVNLINKLPHP